MSAGYDRTWFPNSVKGALESLSDDIESDESDESEELLNKSVSHLLDELAVRYGEVVDEEKEIRLGFEERLYWRWGSAFDVMEFYIMLNAQAGRMFYVLHGTEDVGKDVHEEGADPLVEALVSLHIRACQVSREVLALMRAGYADGAFSRWRALYEIAASAQFIAKRGEETAKRFLNHKIVDDYYEAREYREHSEALGFEPMEGDEWETLEATFEELVEEYGNAFKTSYGWAAEDLDEDPSRRAVVNAVDLERYRPYYAFASDTVHGGSKGAQFRLGSASSSNEQRLLAGPSNYGFTDPAQYTVLMLKEVTEAILSLEDDFHWTVISITIARLMDEVIGEFDVHRRILDAEIEAADDPIFNPDG